MNGILPLRQPTSSRSGFAGYDPALGDVAVFATKTNTTAPASQKWLWNGSRWIVGPWSGAAEQLFGVAFAIMLCDRQAAQITAAMRAQR